MFSTLVPKPSGICSGSNGIVYFGRKSQRDHFERDDLISTIIYLIGKTEWDNFRPDGIIDLNRKSQRDNFERDD